MPKVKQRLEQLRDDIYQHIDDALLPTATTKMLRRAVITLTEVLITLEGTKQDDETLQGRV